jgi:hypothetical protein
MIVLVGAVKQGDFFSIHSVEYERVGWYQVSAMEEGADLSGCIVLDKPAGMLASRSRQTVRVTFTAGGRASFVFQLECRTANKPANMLSSDESACAEGVAHPSVEVVAISDYPILSVTDVGCVKPTHPLHASKSANHLPIISTTIHG